MSVRESDDPALYARVQEQNLLRQYDLLTNCIEIGLAKGIEAFDKYTLWSLNAAAVSNIAQFGGRFREQPIYVGSHIPPHFKEVPELMDQLLSVVHENWDVMDHPPPSAPTPPPSSPAGNQPQSADVDGAGIEPEARGPAGTVPILRSHRQLCDCHPGFVEQANGACAPVSETCVPEGGMASSKSFSHCCPDLVQTEALEPRDGQCISTAPTAHLCTRCGNGSCGPGENTCNCPSDCKP